MINKILNDNAKKTDIFLKKFLDKQTYSSLVSPMKYGALSGGKKIRSSVVLGAGKLFNINESKLLNVCAAVECIHSYSLIHDDLPCMDDDKIRRGKPATHIKFGQSTAILAGNSLLTLAFEMIVDKNYKIENKAKIELIKSLAHCSGHVGIAGGQYLDLNFEKKRKKFIDILDMQKKKLENYLIFAVMQQELLEKKKIMNLNL